MDKKFKKHQSCEFKFFPMTPKQLDSSSSSSISNASSSSCTKLQRMPLRTPHRTPLKLNTNNSTTKKTPHTKTNDRYIPNRINTNLEAGYHMLTATTTNAGNHSKRDSENVPLDGGQTSESDSSMNSNTSIGGSQHNMDTVKRKLLSDMCLMTAGAGGEKQDKVLNLHSRSASSSDLNDLVAATFGFGIGSVSVGNGLGSFGNNTNCGNNLRRPGFRHVSSTPEKILDAPDFKDDFYLNLIDWSRSNLVAVALNKDLYIWNAVTKEISQLFAMDENNEDYITSVSWLQRGDVLAVGTSKHQVELWDVAKSSAVRVMSSHRARIGSLSWNSHLLASGARSGHVHMHDVREKEHHVGTLFAHKQEVCGLKWSNDGRYLASGANDNKVCIWDYAMTHHQHTQEPHPFHTITEHKAAVKALAWCPWQSNLLATGGGTADGKIHVWSVASGAKLASINTGAQVSALLWSSAYHELISSHGYALNQLSIWRYPEMSKQTDLMGHTNRVLSMVQSPDEEMVASVAADETLRFWRCFPLDDRTKQCGSVGQDRKGTSQTSLGRFIR